MPPAVQRDLALLPLKVPMMPAMPSSSSMDMNGRAAHSKSVKIVTLALLASLAVGVLVVLAVVADSVVEAAALEPVGVSEAMEVQVVEEDLVVQASRDLEVHTMVPPLHPFLLIHLPIMPPMVEREVSRFMSAT